MERMLPLIQRLSRQPPVVTLPYQLRLGRYMKRSGPERHISSFSHLKPNTSYSLMMSSILGRKQGGALLWQTEGLLVFTAPFRSNSTEEYNANYYKTLELDKKATLADIKAAYYRLSKLCHPDRNKGKDAAERFAEVKKAYEILGSEESRSSYDKWLKGGALSEVYNPNRSYPVPGSEPLRRSDTFKPHRRRGR